MASEIAFRIFHLIQTPATAALVLDLHDAEPDSIAVSLVVQYAVLTKHMPRFVRNGMLDAWIRTQDCTTTQGLESIERTLQRMLGAIPTTQRPVVTAVGLDRKHVAAAATAVVGSDRKRSRRCAENWQWARRVLVLLATGTTVGQYLMRESIPELAYLYGVWTYPSQLRNIPPPVEGSSTSAHSLFQVLGDIHALNSSSSSSSSLSNASISGTSSSSSSDLNSYSSRFTSFKDALSFHTQGVQNYLNLQLSNPAATPETLVVQELLATQQLLQASVCLTLDMKYPGEAWKHVSKLFLTQATLYEATSTNRIQDNLTLTYDLYRQTHAETRNITLVHNTLAHPTLLSTLKWVFGTPPPQPVFVFRTVEQYSIEAMDDVVRWYHILRAMDTNMATYMRWFQTLGTELVVATVLALASQNELGTMESGNRAYSILQKEYKQATTSTQLYKLLVLPLDMIFPGTYFAIETGTWLTIKQATFILEQYKLISPRPGPVSAWNIHMLGLDLGLHGSAFGIYSVWHELNQQQDGKRNKEDTLGMIRTQLDAYGRQVYGLQYAATSSVGYNSIVNNDAGSIDTTATESMFKAVKILYNAVQLSTTCPLVQQQEQPSYTQILDKYLAQLKPASSTVGIAPQPEPEGYLTTKYQAVAAEKGFDLEMKLLFQHMATTLGNSTHKQVSADVLTTTMDY